MSCANAVQLALIACLPTMAAWPLSRALESFWWRRLMSVPDRRHLRSSRSASSRARQRAPLSSCIEPIQWRLRSSLSCRASWCVLSSAPSRSMSSAIWTSACIAPTTWHLVSWPTCSSRLACLAASWYRPTTAVGCLTSSLAAMTCQHRLSTWLTSACQTIAYCGGLHCWSGLRPSTRRCTAARGVSSMSPRSGPAYWRQLSVALMTGWILMSTS